jgi:hypothetical protein
MCTTIDRFIQFADKKEWVVQKNINRKQYQD